ADYEPNLDKLAFDRDVRILLVGDKNVVVYDTGRGGLQGFQISYPPANDEAIKRGFLAWQPPLPGPPRDLTFITPAPYGPFMTYRVPGSASGLDPNAAGQTGEGPVSVDAMPAGVTQALPVGVGGVTTGNVA